MELYTRISLILNLLNVETLIGIATGAVMSWIITYIYFKKSLCQNTVFELQRVYYKTENILQKKYFDTNLQLTIDEDLNTILTECPTCNSPLDTYKHIPWQTKHGSRSRMYYLGCLLCKFEMPYEDVINDIELTTKDRIFLMEIRKNNLFARNGASNFLSQITYPFEPNFNEPINEFILNKRGHLNKVNMADEMQPKFIGGINLKDIERMKSELATLKELQSKKMAEGLRIKLK